MNDNNRKDIEVLELKINDLKNFAKDNNLNLSDEIEVLSRKVNKMKESIFLNLTSWEQVQIARHSKRPLAMDYIKNIFVNFIELKGERLYADDSAIVTGMAWLDKEPVFIIAQEKGKDTEDKLHRNFGMAHPEGFRKALRIMKMAEKFNKPLITLIDTAGAFPGIEAEERGQAWAIAENLRVMANLKTPVICVVIGEGGSGGALAISVGDKIFMMQNSIYSVISPEGCASILWKDAAYAAEAAKCLKLTAKDLYDFKIIDGIIKEPLGGAHLDYEETFVNFKKNLIQNLSELKNIEINELVKLRYEKYRNIGDFFEK